MRPSKAMLLITQKLLSLVLLQNKRCLAHRRPAELRRYEGKVNDLRLPKIPCKRESVGFPRTLYDPFLIAVSLVGAWIHTRPPLTSSLRDWRMEATRDYVGHDVENFSKRARGANLCQHKECVGRSSHAYTRNPSQCD